jgi:starch-binding outer membrane protein, SusD/RagB family
MTLYKFQKGIAALLLFSMAATSCNKEYTDPSSASGPNVTGNVDGLMNLASGLQRRFTIGRQSPLYTAPVSAAYGVYALRTLNAGNTAETEMETGKAGLTGANSIVTQLWAQSLFTKTEAETILANLGAANDPADRVGLKAYASIFYALSVGGLSQFFEKIPLNNSNNATFNTRQEAIQKVIQILESADADLATTNPSTKFISKVPAGIDPRNTVKALLARFYNMLSMASGTYDAAAGNKAISFAQAASLTIKSEFRFSAATPNPLGEATISQNIFGAVDSTIGLRNGLAPVPAASDPRIGFFISRAGTAPNFIYPLKAFALNQTEVYPVYRPGEMNLIIAENQARQNQLPAAKTALDAVLTKTNDIFGINAAQPAYTGPMTQADIMTAIYKQRRIELFMSGMELEDSRRFNRPAPNAANEERNRNFYPYPLNERNNNTNTPTDPAL